MLMDLNHRQQACQLGLCKVLCKVHTDILRLSCRHIAFTTIVTSGVHLHAELGSCLLQFVAFGLFAQ